MANGQTWSDIYNTFDPDTYGVGLGLTYDPATLQYTGGTGIGSALAGDIMKRLTPEQQWSAGMASAMPGYYTNPIAAQAVESTYQPMYGQYLTGYGGIAEGQPGAGTFAQWVKDRGASSQLARYTPAGVAGTGAITARTTPANWNDIVQVARSMALGASQENLPSAEAIKRWTDVLQDPSQAGALTSLATQNLGGGGIYGNIAQRGLNRMQREFQAANPAASAADWLGYITGKQELVGQPYYVA